MILNLYLIDDEFHALELLQQHIERTPGVQLAGRATNPLLALEEISQRPATINVILLDIDMPELSGLRLAPLLPAGMAVVFTTSFRQYAVEAFEFQAADYLLKPIAYDRFLKCVQRLRNPGPSILPDTSPSETTFFVKTEHKGKWVQIDITEVLYIESLQHYAQLHLTTGKVITYMSLGELLTRLSPTQFSQVHKSFIVQHAYIHSVEAHQLRMTTQIVIPIGRAFHAQFMNKIQPRTWLPKSG